MKAYTKYLKIISRKKIEIINITQEVKKAVEESMIKEGLCLVNSMHITSSVFINDEEQGLKQDFINWLEELAPYNYDRWLHNKTGEDNAHAHLKRTIMGREVVIAITSGKLDLGPWEEIFYGEFDGLREKKVLIKIIGE